MTRTFWARNEPSSFLLANKTLTSPKGLYQVGLMSDYMCRYLNVLCIYVYLFIINISELPSIKGQSKLPMHLQQGRLCVKSNRHRRLFAGRHLEAGQYVAQSGLHLH